MNRKLLIPSILFSLVLGLGLLSFTGSNVYAHEESLPFLQRIRERFNLDEEEVNSFVDEFRAERQLERRTQITERVNEAASEGILTEAQKNELLGIIETNGEERYQHREEVQNWAEENGVDLGELNLGSHGYRGGFGGGEGFKGRGGFGGECPNM